MLAKFGLGISVVVTLIILISRKWKYWELGGALAGILMPYGMPGLPIFLVLTGVRQLKAIPILILYSALLAIMTWIEPSAGLIYSEYGSHLMSIYHISMLGLALVLCFICGGNE